MGSEAGRGAGARATELRNHVHHMGTPPKPWVKPDLNVRPFRLGFFGVYRYQAAMGNVYTNFTHLLNLLMHFSVQKDNIMHIFFFFIQTHNVTTQLVGELRYSAHLVNAVIIIHTHKRAELDQI